jgi:hypothetical protein
MIINSEIHKDRAKITANVSNVTHQFLIDDIPKHEFLIKEQIVELCKFDEKYLRRQIDTIENAISKAKENFCETLDFSDMAEESIVEYKNRMFKLKKLYPAHTAKIDRHIKECPNTLYDHLDSLDKLVKHYKATEHIMFNKRTALLDKYRKEEYIRRLNTCYSDEELVCKKCMAFIRFCRYDCSGEIARKEGIFNGKQYQIHLKPYSYSTDGVNRDIADLTLRIYFRWDGEKIQIGYIGKHL